MEAFSEAATSAPQARFVFGGRFAILFMLSSSHLSNSSASYPDRSIFLSFFIVIPVEGEPDKNMGPLSRGNASGPPVNSRCHRPLQGVRRGIYYSSMLEICAVTDFWVIFLKRFRPQLSSGTHEGFLRAPMEWAGGTSVLALSRPRRQLRRAARTPPAPASDYRPAC